VPNEPNVCNQTVCVVDRKTSQREDAFMNDNLPCIELLDATPAILRRLTLEITETDACWKPAENRFSIAEVISHLSHSEGHCYRARLDLFLSEQMPTFESDDAQMYLEIYAKGDFLKDFEGFEEQRAANVELLRGLPVEVGKRKALHRGVGEITLSQMLHEWALHDLGHVRQTAELVRARKYLQGAGPLGQEYKLVP
jgi:hypothetical protein